MDFLELSVSLFKALVIVAFITFVTRIAGMLTILMTTIVDTNNNTLAKSIASTNTNTFVTILCTVYYIRQRSFFPWLSVNKVKSMIVVVKMAKSL